MLYEGIISEMALHGAAPGRLYHIAAIVPHGMFVASVWETREAFFSYAAAQTLPLIQKRGVDSPEVEIGEVYNTIDGQISIVHGDAVIAHYRGNVDDLLHRYGEMNAITGIASTPPPGLAFHWCAKLADGICVSEHWRSREEFEHFLNGPLRNAMRSAGMPQAKLDYYQLLNTIGGGRVHA